MFFITIHVFLPALPFFNHLFELLRLSFLLKTHFYLQHASHINRFYLRKFKTPFGRIPMPRVTQWPCVQYEYYLKLFLFVLVLLRLRWGGPCPKADPAQRCGHGGQGWAARAGLEFLNGTLNADRVGTLYMRTGRQHFRKTKLSSQN